MSYYKIVILNDDWVAIDRMQEFRYILISAPAEESSGDGESEGVVSTRCYFSEVNIPYRTDGLRLRVE